MANEKHVKILKQGSKVWNKWREDNPDIVPDLSIANLIGADLTGADLTGANLIGANLKFTNGTPTNLRRANLIGANLTRANLREADLTGADLTGANFTDAYLKGANLIGSKVDINTFGMDRFSDEQKKSMIFVNEDGTERPLKDSDWQDETNTETVQDVTLQADADTNEPAHGSADISMGDVRITEEGDRRVTEDGQVRHLEANSLESASEVSSPDLSENTPPTGAIHLQAVAGGITATGNRATITTTSNTKIITRSIHSPHVVRAFDDLDLLYRLFPQYVTGDNASQDAFIDFKEKYKALKVAFDAQNITIESLTKRNEQLEAELQEKAKILFGSGTNLLKFIGGTAIAAFVGTTVTHAATDVYPHITPLIETAVSRAIEYLPEVFDFSADTAPPVTETTDVSPTIEV